MNVDETMKTTTKKSGIGRRRGASKKASLQTSLIVALVSFCVTFFVTLGIYLSTMSSRRDQVRTTDKVYEDAPLFDATKQFLKKRHKHAREGQRQEHRADDQKEIEFDPEDTKFGPILRGEVHLFDLSMGRLSPSSSNPVGYEGVKAKFCKLDWDLHKYNPPKYPMFRFLVSGSGCDRRGNVITVDMATIIEKTKEYDEMMQQKAESGHVDDIGGYVHVMQPTGFVFHESRVGSTLVANSLAAMDPEAHRVFSESTPINMALSVCEDMGSDCDMDMAANLFRDVVYLMGRTNSPKEKHLFFKVSSAGTKRMNVMREALPTTPWIFVYRTPVQTMMSHLDPSQIGPDLHNIQAVCTKSKRYPPDDTIALVAAAGKDISKISDIEFCAAHLASLCESALKELRKSTTGKAVEYDNLVDKLIEDVIPNHFGVEMTEEARQNILEVSKTYSKDKGRKKSEWSEDSEKKEKRASKEIRDASELFMTKSYTELQKYTKNN